MDDIRIHTDRDDCAEIDEKNNIWGDTNEQVFIELMIEEVKKGNLTTNTFFKTGWRNIIQGLKERVGREYTQNQLKNKYRSLRARQRKFKALIKETGIGYNSQTCKVSAIGKLLGRFKKKGCKEYKDLCFIFGDITATGNHQQDTENESHETKTVAYDLKDNEDDVTEVDGNAKETSTRKRKNKSKVISPKKKKVRRTYSHVLENVLLTIGEQSKRKNDLIEQKMQVSSVRSTMLEGNKEDKDLNAMDDFLSALDMLDLEGIAYVKAVKALHNFTLYRKIILRMSGERKKDWVLSL